MLIDGHTTGKFRFQNLLLRLLNFQCQKIQISITFRHFHSVPTFYIAVDQSNVFSFSLLGYEVIDILGDLLILDP